MNLLLLALDGGGEFEQNFDDFFLLRSWVCHLNFSFSEECDNEWVVILT